MSAGKLFDFLTPASSGGGSSALPKNIVNIIEANTGTQTDSYVNHTEVDFIGGVPSVVRKYQDASKEVILYTTTFTWVGGVLNTAVTINHDEGITTTTVFTTVGDTMSVSKTIT